VELIGALSNPFYAGKLDAAARAYTDFSPAELSGGVAVGEPLRPLFGSMRRAVLAKLAAAGKPMRVPEVRAAVVERLGCEVSYHAVLSCLSSAALDEAVPVVRVGRGLYAMIVT
jgi:hypothetical protein